MFSRFKINYGQIIWKYNTQFHFSIHLQQNVVLLEVKEHDPRILNRPLDAAQKGCGLSAINQTMIISQSDVHHRSNGDLK